MIDFDSITRTVLFLGRVRRVWRVVRWFLLAPLVGLLSAYACFGQSVTFGYSGSDPGPVYLTVSCASTAGGIATVSWTCPTCGLVGNQTGSSSGGCSDGPISLWIVRYIDYPSGVGNPKIVGSVTLCAAGSPTYYPPTNYPAYQAQNPNSPIPLSTTPTAYPSDGTSASLGMQNMSGGTEWFAPTIYDPSGNPVSQGTPQELGPGKSAAPTTLNNIPPGDTAGWGESPTENGTYSPTSPFQGLPTASSGDDGGLSDPYPAQIATGGGSLGNTPEPIGTVNQGPAPTEGTSSPITNTSPTGTITILPAQTNTIGTGTTTSPYSPGGIGSSNGGLNGTNGTNGTNGAAGTNASDPTLDGWATNNVGALEGPIATGTNFGPVPWTFPAESFTPTAPSITVPMSSFGVGMTDVNMSWSDSYSTSYIPQFRAFLLLMFTIVFVILYFRTLGSLAK